MLRSTKLGGISVMALTAAMIASAAHADEPGDQPARNAVGEVIVTGQRLEVPLATPFSESVISGETIREQLATPATTIETLLNSEPSIIATSSGADGVRSKIFFRAFSSGQFAQQFDGVSLDDIFNAGFSSQADNAFDTPLQPDNVGGVEIFNGVNNPATNGYNSLGGTINFLPRQPGQSFGGEVGGGFGSFNSENWHVALDSGAIGGLTSLMTFRHSSSDGWQQYTPVQTDNAYWALHFAGNGATEIANYFIWNSQRGYSPNYAPLAILGYLDNFSPNVESEYGHDANWTDILDFKTQLAANVAFTNKIFGGYSDNHRVDFENPSFLKGKTQVYTLDDDTPQSFPFWLNSPAYPQGPYYNPAAVFGTTRLGSDFNSYQYGGWQAGYQPSVTVTLPHNTITFGGNLTYGELHSQEAIWGTDNVPHIVGYNDLWDEHDSRLLASGYVQDEISLFNDNLHITPGVKYLFAATKNFDDVGIYYGLPAGESDGEHYVSPTVGLSYTIMDGLAAYAAYGQNIKFPDISAYYNASTNQAETGPNAGLYVVEPINIRPEHVTDYEIGLRYQRGALFAAIDYYLEDFSDAFINVTDPTTNLSIETNGGSQRYQGVELQLRDDLGKIGIADLQGYLNYSHNEATYTSSFSAAEGSSGNAGQPLAGVPSDLLAFGVTYRGSNWHTTLQGQYVGRQYINQALLGTASSNTLPSRVLMGLNASYDIPVDSGFGIKLVRLGFQVDNLLDTHYDANAQTTSDYNHNPYIQAEPGAPRSVFGSVSVLF